MTDNDRYAIGQQDFKTLRERGALYIDKTPYIEKIVGSMSQYYFLVRPRRFGKSLFLSTLRYFFEGRRELFKGLYIDSTDWNWEPYPVLYLDLNSDRFAAPGMLEPMLDEMFKAWEEKYEITKIPSTFSQRFKNIISTAHEQTGRQVVILVDDYDKPLYSLLNDNEEFERCSNLLASILINSKCSAEHIRLFFLTGVSRFIHTLSDLNLLDISFSDKYSDLFGFTESEVCHNFHHGISKIALNKDISFELAVRLIKEQYFGYRFAPEASKVCSPHSLLNAMNNGNVDDYWNLQGPTDIVMELLRNTDIKTRTDLDQLNEYDLRYPDPSALLFQSGALTLDLYDWDTNQVSLRIPNEEVSDVLRSLGINFSSTTRCIES